MALDTYANLSTAIGTWEERTFTTAETDEFILLAESLANRRLARDYRRRDTATVNTDASGIGTIPTGFVGLVSITRDVLGSLPLKQVSYEAFVQRNPYEVSDDADVFALLSATQFVVNPVTDDDFIVKFSKLVPALTSGNTTNWLLTLAPDFYLFACQAAAAAKFKAYQEAALLEGKALSVLDEIVSQGNVAEFGNAEMTLPYWAYV
jgi:hypothetical protein